MPVIPLYLYNGLTSKSIFRSTYFGKRLVVRIPILNACVGTEFIANITSQKRIGSFFQSQQAGNSGLSTGSLGGDFFDAGDEFGVSRFDALSKFGIRLCVFMGTVLCETNVRYMQTDTWYVRTFADLPVHHSIVRKTAQTF